MLRVKGIAMRDATQNVCLLLVLAHAEMMLLTTQPRRRPVFDASWKFTQRSWARVNQHPGTRCRPQAYRS